MTRQTAAAMPALPNDWAELGINERVEWIEHNSPFHYWYDGSGFNSGLWTDGDGLTINNSGGVFSGIVPAVAAFERWLTAVNQLNNNNGGSHV